MNSAFSSVGKSGGLLVAWDLILFELKPYLCVGGILLTGSFILAKRNLTFINVYGLCSERRQFWERVDATGLLAQSDLILAGDLNFSLGPTKVWAMMALPYSLASFFKNLIAKNHLVDI
jgi:hypothetical protein